MREILNRALGSAVAVAFAGMPVAADSPDWQKLVEIGKKHGLTQPGPAARLALIHSESWSVVGNQSHPHDPANYQPGWVLEERPRGGIQALVGLREVLLEPREAREPLWRQFAMDVFEPRIGGYVVKFNSASTFAVAVQCAARGDRSRANALWLLFSEDDWFSDGFEAMRYEEGSETPELLLGAMLFDRLELRLSEPGADVAGIERSMKSLFEDFPPLADERRKVLLASVSATASAPVPKAGSVEALLIEYGQSRGTDLCEEPAEDEASPKERIIRLGFAAIPELLRLESDPRLTSLRWTAIMKRPSSPKMLGDLAKEILGDLMPEAATGGTSFDLPVRGDFAAAWKQVRQEDELAYFERIALKRDKGGALVGHKPAFAVLSYRGPDRLANLVSRFELEAGEHYSPWDLAEALVNADLDRAEKLKLLVGLASDGGLARRRAATQVLAGFDPGAARAPALELIGMLPRDAKGAYWTSAEGKASHVVLAMDDDAVWQAFFEKARRAEVGLTLEWMNPFNYRYVGDRLRERRLAFLAGFLDDPRTRDAKKNAKKYDGPCAAFTFPIITVRDFAAMQIASILDIDPLDSPDATWTEARWSALREKASERLKAEGIRSMKEK